MMTQVLQGIEIKTENINFAATLVAHGCHLRDVSPKNDDVPPRCVFDLVWSREPLKSLETVPSEVLAEVHDLLDRVIILLDHEGERVRSADLAAVKGLLADDPDLERSSAEFARLWRAKRLRVEPQEFDRARALVTRRMRDAQKAVMGG